MVVDPLEGVPHVLLAYNADGRVVATLDYLSPVHPVTQEPLGRVDLALVEASGAKLRHLYMVEGAVGSGTWPEFLGVAAHDFYVVVDPSYRHRIRYLWHPESDHVRDREDIENAVAMEVVVAAEEGRPPDLSPLIGDIGRRLVVEVDAEGRSTGRLAKES